MKYFLKLSLIVITFGTGFFFLNEASADSPIRYQGRLRDAAGNYGYGNFTIRFSIWDNPNTQSGDINNGSINTSAPNYLGWTESHEVTIQENDKGLFVVFMGEIEPFPFSLLYTDTDVHIQIDIKETGSSDTTYETIDSSPSSSRNRRILDTPPHSNNTKKIDNREIGYNPNDVPYLDGGGVLPDSTIPNGTEQNEFILDRDGDAGVNDTIALKFGESLAKSLSWNGLNSQFEFNDTVSITGDLTVSGSINGVFIGEKQKTKTLTPDYPNSIFYADGTNNSGSMYEETENSGGKTYQMIRWETKQTTIQDYGVQIKYKLPHDFRSFIDSGQIRVSYKTEGTLSDSFIDIVIEKEGTAGVDQINGAGTGQRSNEWTGQSFTLEPTTTWNAGDTLILKIKMFATQNFESHISDIEIQYRGE